TEEFNVYSRGDQPLRATICWTDPPGTPPARSLNPTSPMLVNDLDLRLVRKLDDSTYFPWILDPSNPSAAATTGDNTRRNLEQVFIAAPLAGSYTLRISHKGTLSGGSQAVSVVVTGNVPSIRPLAALGAPAIADSLNPGDILHDSLKLQNKGYEALTWHASVA